MKKHLVNRIDLRPRLLLPALLSGLLATLPFLDFSLYPLAWIALVPLGLALWGRSTPTGAALGLAAGLVNSYWGFYWLEQVTAPGYVLLGMYLALYWAAWGAVTARLSRLRPGWTWWASAAAWAGLEFVRSRFLTGLPWNLLGISQARLLPLIQVAAWTSVTGVSFLVALFNTAVFQALATRRESGKRAVLVPAAAAALILAVTGLGLRQLARGRDFPPGEGLRMSLIQGGVWQDHKWDPALAPRHFSLYLNLSRQAQETGPDIIVWPESALPYSLETPGVMPALGGLAASGKTWLLIGADYQSPPPERRHFNSAFLIGPDGEAAGRYDKVHLVPYGEYTPLKSVFPFLGRVVPWEEDFSPGESLEPLVMSRPADDGEEKVGIGVLICYEDIFPHLARKSIRQGAGLLVNITNDAWFGRTAAPFQHAQAARFRAVENRVFMARCANTGYSVVFDPWGRKVGDVSDERGESLFISAWETFEVFPMAEETFYRRRGEVFNWLVLAAALGAMMGTVKITK